jgi:ribosome-binding factor A
MGSKRDRRGRGAPTGETIDPAIFFGPPRDARGERKVQQVCREVERTLSYAFGECADELVRDLVVVAVEPAPDGSRLMVSLCPSSGKLAVDIGELLARVQEVRGFLRREIAAALQRKRTPELAFRIVPPIEREEAP